MKSNNIISSFFSKNNILQNALLAAVYFAVLKYGINFDIIKQQFFPLISYSFPASGIATAAILIFGYRLWLGIILGGLLFYFPYLVISSGVASDIIIYIAIVSSVIQAVFSVYLIKYFKLYSDNIKYFSEVFKISFLCGPVGCLISASLINIALYLLNSVSLIEVIFNWCSWWIIDVIGNILIVPAVLLALPLIAGNIKKQQIMKKINLLFCYFVIFLIIAGAYKSFVNLKRQNTEDVFYSRAHNDFENIKYEINYSQNMLLVLKAFYNSSVFVSRDEFKIFTNAITNSHFNLFSFYWLPKVENSQKRKFQYYARREGYRGFIISEQDDSGNFNDVKDRKEYFPIYYLRQSNNKFQNRVNNLLGFDAASNPKFLNAIANSTQTGLQTAVVGAGLFNKEEDKYDVFIFDPVFNNIGLKDIEERKKNLSGFLLTSFNFNNLINFSLKRRNYPEDLNIVVKDSGGNNLFYRVDDENFFLKPQIYKRSFQLDMDSDVWWVDFFITKKLLTDNLFENFWQILFIGLLLPFFSSILFLLVTGHADSVKYLFDKVKNGNYIQSYPK